MCISRRDNDFTHAWKVLGIANITFTKDIWIKIHSKDQGDLILWNDLDYMDYINYIE